jgi:hypothetical protein
MRGVSALNAELLSKLHAAAGELLPVIVEIEPSLARFSAFIDSIRVDGDQRHPWLVLAPIAANALPIGATTVRIRPAEGGGDWVLTAHHVERDGPAQVKVRLTDAHVQPFENGHVVVAVHPTDLLVLVVPGGLHGSSTYV